MNSKLKIYFYHTRLTRESYEEWKDFRFPGHILYGLPLLEKYGIQSVMHQYKPYANRWKLMLYTTKEILFCKEKYEVLYGTSFRGLELIIFLRALGLYRKPIVVWHHTALRKSPNRLKEAISRFFYRGIDHMFLFSRKLIQDSIATHKVPEHKLALIHWGPDLAFYDHLLKELPAEPREGFISTGKENRDLKTMLQAFSQTDGYISLVNLVADKEVVRELVADTMTVDNVRSELESLLYNKVYRNKVLEEYDRIIQILGPAGASGTAAREMVALLKK